MDENIISWNAANWITVLVMVVVGYTIVGGVAKIIMQRRASAA